LARPVTGGPTRNISFTDCVGEFDDIAVPSAVLARADAVVRSRGRVTGSNLCQ
jgi:hypothetical protein